MSLGIGFQRDSSYLEVEQEILQLTAIAAKVILALVI